VIVILSVWLHLSLLYNDGIERTSRPLMISVINDNVDYYD